MIHTDAGRRASIAGWVAAVGMTWLAYRGAMRHSGFMPTDFPVWKTDWHNVLGCLASTHDGISCAGAVSKFPLAYLINASLLSFEPEREEQLLALANGLAILLPLVALALTQGLSALRRMGWPYVLAMALSPLPMFYVATGALEVQAGVFCGIYLGLFARLLASPDFRVPRRTAWVLGIAGLVFPLYKDTAAAFVGVGVIVTLACRARALRELASTSTGRSSLLRGILLISVPVLLGEVLELAYCWFRYGVPLPISYMREAAQAGPSITKSVEFLAGSVLSPNGGVLVFWGLPVFLAVAGWRVAGWVPRAEVVIPSCASAVISCIGLARWWTPFGWDGWGDRLMVPAMVTALVALPFCMRPRHPATEPAFSWPVWVACSPVVIYSFYYVAIPYSQSQARSLQDSLVSGPACIHMREFLAIPQESSFWRTDVYYSCARERMLYVPRPHIRMH